MVVYLGSHRLSAQDQGIYYALTSIAALQSVFEIGFPSVLLQYTGHERQRISSPDHADAMTNVAHILRLADRWFRRAAVLCLLSIVSLAGLLFHAAPTANWVGPAIALAVMVSSNMATTGRWAVFEGLGHVEQVLLARLVAAILSLAFALVLFEHGLALYVPSTIALASLIAFALVINRPARATWREVLSFAPAASAPAQSRPGLSGLRALQMRTAASYFCGYLSFQAVTLIAYRNGSPALAATIGIAMTIMLASVSVVSLLIQIRMQTFLRLIADQNLVGYFALGRRVQWQSLGAMSALALIGLVTLWTLRHFGASWAQERLPSPPVLAAFMASAAINQCIAVQATQVRNFKAEPYVIHSMLVAAAVVLAVSVASVQNSALTLALGYLGVNLLVALPYSSWIFRDQRRDRMAGATALGSRP